MCLPRQGDMISTAGSGVLQMAMESFLQGGITRELFSASWTGERMEQGHKSYRGVKEQLFFFRFRWVAEIRIRRGRSLFLGGFDTAEEAAKAYDRAATNLRGRRRHPKLNFPAEQLALPAKCLLRGLSSSRNDSRVHRVDVAQGIIAHPRKVNIAILDSGSPVHCTGDISLLSDYTEGGEGVPNYYGAGNEPLKVCGFGSIRNARFHIKDVLYIPSINRKDSMETIFSVSKLRRDGYRFDFDEEGSCTVMDTRSRVWSWTKLAWRHEIVGKGRDLDGHYHMDYLRMRAPVSISSEGAGVVKSLWNAASSGWSTVTGRLRSALRPDVSQSHGVTARRRPDV
ncbi:hypothetical protein U9M48_001026 [Paspalum notatum var. saurae]|uniref:AP2/ERF domain-containing protein n=1 Tax=Paspalum notatum var. saurae TaxID=547442 RepID=A0AAQ3PFU7_PASNO